MNESEKIARRAVKIALFSLFALVIVGMILLSVFLVEIHSIAGMSKKIEVLEAKIENLHKGK